VGKKLVSWLFESSYCISKFIVFQLTNGDEEAKISALLGLGCLENVELNKEALRTVAPMMIDPSTTIQVAAANALR
jgi:hypothetical protein